MQATASSSSVKSNRMVVMIMLRAKCELKRLRVAELIIVINRWPAVMLAVSRTPRATGRMSKLTVSIMIINGISGVGEPSGSMWASVVVGFFSIPVITVASQSGSAKAMFIDSWEVVVYVYGRSPSMFDKRIKTKRLVSRLDHFCPMAVSWLVILSIIFLKNQVVTVVIRFPMRWRLWLIIMTGINIERKRVGIERNSGLANCSNMFMFMVGL